MARPAIIAAAWLAALSLAAGLVSPAAAADGPPPDQPRGDVAASAAPGGLDWNFREVGSGRAVTFEDEGISSEAAWPMVCDLGMGDDPSWWTAGTFHLGGTDGVLVRFGRAGDLPRCGDWDGDGVDTPGVMRGNVFYLAGSNRDGGAPVTSFTFGRAGDFPVVGDWDGNGTDTVAVARGSNTYLFASTNTGGGGQVRSLLFGVERDHPVAGNFDGTGVDTLGLYRRNGQFYVTFARPGGTARVDWSPNYWVHGFPVAGQLPGAERASVGLVLGTE